MEHGLKDIAFYVKKTYNTLYSCHNFPAGSRQAARGARICETNLLQKWKRKLSLKKKRSPCQTPICKYMYGSLQIFGMWNT